VWPPFVREALATTDGCVRSTLATGADSATRNAATAKRPMAIAAQHRWIEARSLARKMRERMTETRFLQASAVFRLDELVTAGATN
jgi:hypothetical protein